MTLPINRAAKSLGAAALALSLTATLGGCATGGSATANSSLNSVNQPVVQSSNFMLDLAAGSGGLSVPEQARLADWFETLDLGYGDRVAIDDPSANAASREDVAAVLSRFSLLLERGAPVTVGYLDRGNIRVVVTRSTASVPGCPNWSNSGTGNLGNNTSPGFGCSINGNYAAMIADPQHLLEGASGTGETTVMSSTKAIETYRSTAPTGAGGLSAESASGS
jgi:pilus assembly protein CpaD